MTFLTWPLVAYYQFVNIYIVCWSNLVNFMEDRFKVYLPFFLFGMVFWEIVASTVNKSISIYKLNENLIKTINIPKFAFKYPP